MSSIPPKLFMRSVTATVDTIQIQDLRMTFRVHRTLKPHANTCELTVYNLNPAHRKALEEAAAATVSITAGYVGQTALLFLGDLRVGFSVEESPNFVTKISGGDGEQAIKTARVKAAAKKGTPKGPVLAQAIAAQMQAQGGVQPGNLNDFKAALPQGPARKSTVAHGSAFREMNALTQGIGWEWSIQQKKLQFLKAGRALPGPAFVVSQSTGMVHSPSVDNDGSGPVLTVQTLLIPGIVPGVLIQVQSARLQGTYRVESVDSVGDTHGQEWYHKIEAKKF